MKAVFLYFFVLQTVSVVLTNKQRVFLKTYSIYSENTTKTGMAPGEKFPYLCGMAKNNEKYAKSQKPSFCTSLVGFTLAVLQISKESVQ